jgi:hypothetical protein
MCAGQITMFGWSKIQFVDGESHPELISGWWFQTSFFHIIWENPSH